MGGVKYEMTHLPNPCFSLSFFNNLFPCDASSLLSVHDFVSSVSLSDQTLPDGATVPARGAVVLCYDVFSVCRAGTALTNSSLRDVLVFSENQRLLSSLSTTRGRQVMPALR